MSRSRAGVARARGPVGTLSTVSDAQSQPAGDPGTASRGEQAAAPAGAVSPAPAGHEDLPGIRAGIAKGGAPRYHTAAQAAGKLFARDRLALLVDAGTLAADGIFANAAAAISVTRLGAQPSAPSRHEIERMVATA